MIYINKSLQLLSCALQTFICLSWQHNITRLGIWQLWENGQPSVWQPQWVKVSVWQQCDRQAGVMVSNTIPCTLSLQLCHSEHSEGPGPGSTHAQAVWSCWWCHTHKVTLVAQWPQLPLFTYLLKVAKLPMPDVAELVNLDTTRVKARFSAFNFSFSALSFCNCCKKGSFSSDQKLEQGSSSWLIWTLVVPVCHALFLRDAEGYSSQAFWKQSIIYSDI